MARETWDVAVVGAGLVGAAAAKYLACDPGTLVGIPEESTDTATNNKLRVVLVGPSKSAESGVYNCHEDEGRICRTLDVDDVWAELAKRSMARYEALERSSGVKFHAGVGCLAVGRAGGAYLDAVEACAERQGIRLEKLDQKAMEERFPDLALDARLFKDDYDSDGDFDDAMHRDTQNRTPAYAGLFEQAPAGHVSPRKLVAAQLALFERCDNAARIDAVVHDIEVLQDQDGSPLFHLLRKDHASTIAYARKVLVATNAWTNFKNLTPRKFALELTTQTAVARQVDTSKLTHQLPSLIVKAGDAPFGSSKASKLDACYFLPPIEYPDGRVLCKLGHGTYFERPLTDQAACTQWYALDQSDPDRLDSFARCELAALLDRLFKRNSQNILLRPTDEKLHVILRCIIPKTPTKRPYIAHFHHDCLVACLGCNGYAAKSSDELGRIAALRLLRGRGADLGPNIPHDAFNPVFLDSSP